MKKTKILFCLLFIPVMIGCQLQEVRTKNKLGAEWRHRGSNRAERVRYAVQPGFELKWDKGVSTGISYRRRDDDDGPGDHDDGLFVDFSFPLWKAKKKNQDALAKRVERLEEQLAQLQAQIQDGEQ